MKKGRHRRYEEARALKRSSAGSLDALIRERESDVDPELLAKWPEYAELDVADVDDAEIEEEKS